MDTINKNKIYYNEFIHDQCLFIYLPKELPKIVVLVEIPFHSNLHYNINMIFFFVFDISNKPEQFDLKHTHRKIFSKSFCMCVYLHILGVCLTDFPTNIHIIIIIISIYRCGWFEIICLIHYQIWMRRKVNVFWWRKENLCIIMGKMCLGVWQKGKDQEIDKRYLNQWFILVRHVSWLRLCILLVMTSSQVISIRGFFNLDPHPLLKAFYR